MKVDRIIRNAIVFTSNIDKPMATAFAVNNGKFVYVGDETGLSEYEGEVMDYNGKFIMPGIIDSHVHIGVGVGVYYTDDRVYVEGDSKQEMLDFMADYIKQNPGVERYRFELERDRLHGDDIAKEELDLICPDSELLIVEMEAHSIWVNSKILKKHQITDNTPDIVPGLSYYVRKD
ncbi:MAG: amidohydrolase family protein, partial [Solobacterium sp.]|nr:amidohydrolase family protein [Solobacterium sp.]